jgi:hypothetical protein
MKIAEIDELADQITTTIASLRKNLNTLDTIKTELQQGG